MKTTRKEKLRGFRRDAGDLTQMMIIIGGFAVAAIVFIGVITSVVFNKGESAASCIAGAGSFASGSAAKEKCEGFVDEEKAKSYNAVNSGYGYGSNNNLNASEYKKVMENSKKIDVDLNEFAKKAAAFKASNGHYPKTIEELNSLSFTATKDAYPEEHGWNLEYCPSTDGESFVIATTGYNNYVHYTSNKNSIAQKYRLPGDDHAATGGTSYPSPCYSGTSYSAADRAGIKGVGVADEHENVTVSGPKSIAAKMGAKWATWA